MQKSSEKPSKTKLIDISESSLLDDLKDPEFALGYLEEVLRDGSTAAFLVAVRQVAIAQGGMKRLASSTKLGRESMYKALAPQGNPHFSTVVSILEGLGLRLSVKAQARRKKRVA